MAIDTVVSGDSLDVVGPPSSVTVNVDIGPQGTRGATFFSGYGIPNPTSISGSQLGDLYINRELGANYGIVYRLSAVPGGTSWQSILKFQPNAYSNSFTPNFISGSGSISIPLEDFYSNAPENLDVLKILIQVTAESALPVFVSISNKVIADVGDPTVKTFIAELQGSNISSGSILSPLSGSATKVNVFITSGVGE
jgi:hypothetical protein